MPKSLAVFGYGPVRRALKARFVARGDRVMVVQRKTPRALPFEAEFQPADLESAAQAAAACKNVERAIRCIGVPYDSRNYTRVWPIAM